VESSEEEGGIYAVSRRDYKPACKMRYQQSGSGSSREMKRFDLPYFVIDLGTQVQIREEEKNFKQTPERQEKPDK